MPEGGIQVSDIISGIALIVAVSTGIANYIYTRRTLSRTL
jgi:hypothetical protein